MDPNLGFPGLDQLGLLPLWGGDGEVRTKSAPFSPLE